MLSENLRFHTRTKTLFARLIRFLVSERVFGWIHGSSPDYRADDMRRTFDVRDTSRMKLDIKNFGSMRFRLFKDCSELDKSRSNFIP